MKKVVLGIMNCTSMLPGYRPVIQVLDKQKPIKMQTLNLNNMGLAPMEKTEMQEQNGGFLPAIAIGICWGIMLCSSAVAAGIAQANGLKPAWK